MLITVITKKGFLHGRMKFEEGKTYEVEDIYAGYFLGMGWAEAAKEGEKATTFDSKKLGANAPPVARRGDSTLEIQDVHKASSSEVRKEK